VFSHLRLLLCVVDEVLPDAAKIRSGQDRVDPAQKNPWPRILRHGVARRAVSYKSTRNWRIAEPEPAG
jgi:hypothetical protein